MTRSGPRATRTLAARGAEGRKQGLRAGIAHHLPFRVPLHCHRKALRLLDAERLDQAIGRTRLDGEPRAEAIDSLRVQRVDAQALVARQLAQHPTLLEHDVVRGTVLDLEGQSLVLAMIELALELVDFLMECATEGDVHLLEPAANTEHGDPDSDRFANERQCRRITRRIVESARSAGGAR